MKIAMSFVARRGVVKITVLAAAAGVMAGWSPPASAQPYDPVNGAISGAAQGTYQGKTTAGPVGGVVGGALGAGVGAVSGTLNGVFSPMTRGEREPVPMPPKDVGSR